MSITFEGVDKLNAKLKKLAMLSEEEAKKTLTVIALDLQGKAQMICPVGETGDLAGSAYTEINGLEAEVGFSEEYALIQHENMEYRHKPGKQAKYLENPFKENRNKYVDLIGKAISRAVKK